MAYDKQELIDLLRHLGYDEAAEEAAHLLPDQASEEQVIEFGTRHGISRGELMNRMGGSP
ncbi:MAG: hypothetical protein JO345_29505 [Streptosporangiaceae bacterium]|nr:hypothetical protein [Streptosporangiaceae bacterium]